jgi:hypothetical protein
MNLEKQLCTKEAAKYLGFSTSKLEKDRLCGRGPSCYQDRKGGKVLYPIKALDEYKQSIFRIGGRHES